MNPFSIKKEDAKIGTPVSFVERGVIQTGTITDIEQNGIFKVTFGTGSYRDLELSFLYEVGSIEIIDDEIDPEERYYNGYTTNLES